MVQLVKTLEHPIELEKSVLITTMLEYEKNKLILGLDEPGFLFIEKPPRFVSNTMQQHAGQFDITQFKFLEDRQVKNKVCCSILRIPGYDPDTRPFVVSRNRQCINLINVKTMTL